jgi:S1-C subfamily serine protease
VSLLLVLPSAFAGTKPRIHVMETSSSSGPLTGVALVPWLHGSGARPQTAEIIKTFLDRCSSVIVTSDEAKAVYVVLLEHEGGKDVFGHDNKVVVFNSSGDVIHGHSTLVLGEAVKDACKAIADNAQMRVSESVEDNGCVVVAMNLDSPLAQSGIKNGDVITSINGSRVRTLPDLDRLLADNHGAVKLDYLIEGGKSGAAWRMKR